MDEKMGILERIHAAYYQLTATERKVADYVIANWHQIQFMSITQLADECGVADATISRFCKNLHLKGFNAIKIELARHSAAGHLMVTPNTVLEDTMESRIQMVGKVSQDAVTQTVTLMNHTDVDRAVRILDEAKQVLCMGSGGSMILANECAHLFGPAGGKFRAVADAHSQMSATVTAPEGSAIILFSYSGSTRSGLEILELAQARNIPTILVTRFHKSPAAKLATVTLLCGSNEGPFQAGSVAARVAQLVVMDVLYQEYYIRNRNRCDENIELVASALTSQHV